VIEHRDIPLEVSFPARAYWKRIPADYACNTRLWPQETTPVPDRSMEEAPNALPCIYADLPCTGSFNWSSGSHKRTWEMFSLSGSLAGDHPTVDVQYLAGDVLCILRNQEDGCPPHILGCLLSSQRRRGFDYILQPEITR
jgi:hypothetical protein